MTALIPAAGKGTRFLPLTRMIPKEMLPIGAKPAIQVIIEEAFNAGANDALVVISEEKEIIRKYLNGVEEFAGKIRFVNQREQKGLGDAVLQAADMVSDRVLILLGDAVVVGENASLEMVRFSDAHGGASVVGLEEVSPDRVNRYGIASLQADSRIVDLVEKPDVGKAPSNLAIAGRYLLDAAIFRYLASQTPGRGGEIQLTDSIRRMLADMPVYALKYSGKRQDIGNPHGYFSALEAFYGKCKD